MPQKEIVQDIRCFGLPSKPSVRSYIHKQIMIWAQAQPRISFVSEKPLTYRCLIFRLPGTHYFQCRITLEAGRASWTSQWGCNGFHEAVGGCLKHMIPVIGPDSPRLRLLAPCEVAT